MTLGWPISASLSGQIYLRIGFRNTALSAACSSSRAPSCGVLGRHRDPGPRGRRFVIGLGLGLTSSPSIVAVQSVVGWDRRGVVTGTNMFFRSIGSAVGAAVFGAIANTTLDLRFADAPAGSGTGSVVGAAATARGAQGEGHPAGRARLRAGQPVCGDAPRVRRAPPASRSSVSARCCSYRAGPTPLP